MTDEQFEKLMFRLVAIYGELKSIGNKIDICSDGIDQLRECLTTDFEDEEQSYSLPAMLRTILDCM